MDQPCKVAKPARGQLNRDIKCSYRCIRGKYIYINCCLFLLIYQVYFYLGTCAVVHGPLLLYNMCDYSGMCVCIYVWSSHTYSKGKDQPGKVANPARGQLAEQGN